MTWRGQDTTTKVMLNVASKCACSKAFGKEPVNNPFSFPPSKMWPHLVKGWLAAYAWRASRSPEMQVIRPKTEKNVKSSFSQIYVFHFFEWNWWGLGVSRMTARTVRRHKHKFSSELVLHDIRKFFSEILEFQCTGNGLQNLLCCPGSLQDK